MLCFYLPMTTNELPTPPAETPDHKLLQDIFISVERTRKMFLWTLVLSVLTVLLPMIGLVIAIPIFLNTYLSALDLGSLGL